MALPDPLPIDQFVARLPVGSIRMDLGETASMSRTAGGATLSSDLGDRLWQGEIALDVMEAREADFAHARINLLRGGGRRFEVYDTRRPYPFHDPEGTILGAAAPAIAALDPDDFRVMSLSGLPAGYRLSVGDYLGYAHDGVRRALHIVQEEVVAAATGVTPLFEVLPHRRRGATVGVAVTLVRAHCLAAIDPGSTTIGASRRTIAQGTVFAFTQDLR